MAWEESQASTEVFDLLRNLEVTPIDDQYGGKSYYRSRLVVDPVGESQLKAMIRGFSKETWQSFRETLSQRPAWNRVWILQEIVLARKVLILCGRREVSWETLRRFLDACMEVSTDQTTRTINDHVIDAIDRAYYIYFYREARGDSSATGTPLPRHGVRSVLGTRQILEIGSLRS